MTSENPSLGVCITCTDRLDLCSANAPETAIEPNGLYTNNDLPVRNLSPQRKGKYSMFSLYGKDKPMPQVPGKEAFCE